MYVLFTCCMSVFFLLCVRMPNVYMNGLDLVNWCEVLRFVDAIIVHSSCTNIKIIGYSCVQKASCFCTRASCIFIWASCINADIRTTYRRAT